jgi:hypothetical protein
VIISFAILLIVISGPLRDLRVIELLKNPLGVEINDTYGIKKLGL